MSYRYTHIFIGPEGEENIATTRSYEYPTPESAALAAEQNQPPERQTRWNSSALKGIDRFKDWQFGLASASDYICAVVVHPTEVPTHVVERIWLQLTVAAQETANRGLHKRRTAVIASTTPPKVYLSPEAALHMVNQRRQAEGKQPYTQQRMDALSTRARIRHKQTTLSNEQYEREQARLEELPPI